MEIQTEGNPEFKTINIAGKESSFTVETFGRPKPNGIILDPHNFILKSSQRLRVRGMIARGETLAAPNHAAYAQPLARFQDEIVRIEDDAVGLRPPERLHRERRFFSGDVDGLEFG